MGEFTKIVRWLAPGSTAILFGLVVLYLTRTLLHAARDYSVPLIAITSNISLVLAAVSVPAGLIIYQFYFYMFVRQSLLGLWVPGDDAVMVDEALRRSYPGIAPLLEGGLEFQIASSAKEEQIAATGWRRWILRSLGPLAGPDGFLWLIECPEGGPPFPVPRNGTLMRVAMRRYMKSKDRNKAALEERLYRVRTDAEIADAAFEELDRLGDIYHSLGAVRTAIPVGSVLGWIYVVFLDILEDRVTFAYWPVVMLAAALTTLLVVASVGVVHVNRRHCRLQRITHMAMILGFSRSARSEGGG